MHALRIHAERDPIILLSCVLGGFGLVMPFLWGDGGRAKENASTSYAYRIKNLYPRS